MGYLGLILLIMAGIASISTFIVSKKPELKDELEKITTYSGYMGVALFVIGLLSFFGILAWPAWWNLLSLPGWGLAKIVIVLYAPISIILGFIQGYSLIDKYVLNKAKDSGGGAGAKFDKAGDAAYAKLAKLSVPFGFIGLGVAIVALLYQMGVLS